MRNQPSRGPTLTPYFCDPKRPYGDGKNHEMMNTPTAKMSAEPSSVSYVESPVYQLDKVIERILASVAAVAQGPAGANFFRPWRARPGSIAATRLTPTLLFQEVFQCVLPACSPPTS